MTKKILVPLLFFATLVREIYGDSKSASPVTELTDGDIENFLSENKFVVMKLYDCKWKIN